MIIILNKEILEVPEKTNLHALVIRLKYDPLWSLASVNNQLIQHSQWEQITLQEDDMVEIFSYNDFGAGI